MTTEDKKFIYDPNCSICHGKGYYCIGDSGTDEDGYAPIFEECDCFIPAEDSTENMPDIIYASENSINKGNTVLAKERAILHMFEIPYYSQAELDRRVADHYSDGYLSEDEVIGLLGKLTDAMGRNVDGFDSDAGFLGCCERLVDSAVEYIAEAEERQREKIKDKLYKGISGCSDHNCLIRKPEGMGTNGGCRCYGKRSAMQIILGRLKAILNAGGKGDE